MYNVFTTYLILLPVTIILIWVVVFIVNRRYVDTHDRIFLSYIISEGLGYAIICSMLVDDPTSYLFVLMDNVQTFLGLIICPLLFLYMRSMTKDYKWHHWYWWLFSPAIILGTTTTIISFIIGWDRVLEIRPNYHSHITPDPNSILESLYGLVGISLFNLTMEILSFIMIVMCLVYIIRYNRNAEEFFSTVNDSSYLQIKRVQISFLMILVTLGLMTYFIHAIQKSGQGFLLLMSLHISFWLWIMIRNAYGILMTKEKQILLDVFSDNSSDTRASVRDDISDEIEKWQFRADKPFCRDGISLADLAQDIGISPRVISIYINKNKGVNFRRWINMLRVEESKRLMTEKPTEKLTYIAMVCGFSDIATYSKTFRLIEGCSPNEFRQKVNP